MIMKLRLIVIGLMILFCSSVFGQQQKNVPITAHPKTTVVLALDEAVSQLQIENQTMQKQLEIMEKEVELYRGDVRHWTSQMNANMSHWLVILTIIMAILGVAIPLIMNNNNKKIVEKLIEDAKNKAEEAKEQASQAKQAVTEIEDLKKHVTVIEEKIKSDTSAATKAANDAKASQLFTQALNDKDSSLAVELYNQAIELKPDFVEAYNNRGVLKSNMGDQAGALEDYNTAISLKPNYAEAYNNRGVLKSNMGDQAGALEDYKSRCFGRL